MPPPVLLLNPRGPSWLDHISIRGGSFIYVNIGFSHVVREHLNLQLAILICSVVKNHVRNTRAASVLPK